MRSKRSDMLEASLCKRYRGARSSMFALAIVSALVTPAARSDAARERPLRLCADPTNLPFSSENPLEPGFYLEIGQALAQALEMPVSYDWYKSYFGKRTVRVTLLSKQCDAMIGLPLSENFMGPAIIFSKKFATQGYALVGAKDQTIGGIDDLKGKRVAVQYETTPQNLLAGRDDIEKITVLTPEEGMRMLDRGKADVAFIWGPVAGWLNKTAYNDRYRVQTTKGRGLLWDVGIGFAKTSKELRDQVDAVLPQLDRTIADLSTKYGLPTDQPIQFSATQAAAKQVSIEVPVGSVAHAQLLPTITAPEPAASAAMTVADAASSRAKIESTTADEELVSAGKRLFNGTCAHCHGHDAVQSERRINLRLLQKRYGSDTRSKFWTTVREGRSAKGMPSWKDVLKDEQVDSLYAYLLTVQTPDDPAD